MKVKTINGEIVNISKKELIWTALDVARTGFYHDEKVYIPLLPRREGIFISRDAFSRYIDIIITDFV